MGLPEHSADVKSSGLACDKWSMEWTFPVTVLLPVLDVANGEGGAWTDTDPRIPDATAVAFSSTGVTLVKFPKSRRARVVYCELEPATKANTNFRRCVVSDLDALNGTLKVNMLGDTNQLANPLAIGARVRLQLELEYR